MKIPDYGKVYAVGHRTVANLFDGPVVVEEKVDGSQFSMSVNDGQLCLRSHRADMTDHCDQMFSRAQEVATALQEILQPGWIYRCEYLSKPKHNTLSYDRVPVNHLVLLDVEPGPGAYLDYPEKVDEAARIGLEVTPCIYAGCVPEGGVAQLIAMLERTSFLGGPIEGIVVKNYAYYTEGGHALKGKLVSEDFKEKHNADWKQRNPGQNDAVQMIIESYRTEARWRKAVQHLRESGVLVDEPKDIGPLMKELAADFLEECTDEVAAQLFAHFAKTIVRGIGSGFPEWYKRELAGAELREANL